MLLLHLLTSLARADVPLPAAELIFQVEVQRLPAASLAPLLADPSPGVRAAATRAAGRLGADATLLAGPAADVAPEVRRAGAVALGFAADAVPVLRARLGEEHDPATRSALVTALGRVGGPDDVGRITALLTGPDRVAAAQALGRMGVRRVDGAGAPAVLEALLAQVERPFFRWRDGVGFGPEERRAAAWALSRIPLSPAPSALVQRLQARALADTDGRIRAWLVRAAAPLATDVAFLARAAHDADPAVRLAAVRAMARHGCDAAAVVALVADPDVGVRVEALTTAGACPDVPTEPLAAALASATSAERAAALRSLDARRALPSALAEFQTEAWPLPVRIAAVELMKERPRLLRLALTHADPRLRSAAAGALLGPEPAPRASEVAELLGAKDPILVQAAAQAAAEHPDPTLEGPLVALLERRDVDRASAAASVKALDALYATGRLPVPRVETRAALRRWLSLPELRTIRDRVVRTIGGQPPPVGHPDRALPSLGEVRKVRSARVTTTAGELRLRLLPEVAPLTVHNFTTLAERDYFDGLSFHRVVSDFVVQTGDPRGDGWGGPGYEIPDELSDEPYTAGTVGMALSGPDTGGSQWFVTTAPHPHLDFGYTVFGRLTQGLRVAQAISVDDRILDVVIERVP